jgi:hypothetical protein
MSLLVGDVSIAEKVFSSAMVYTFLPVTFRPSGKLDAAVTSLAFRVKPAARGHHAIVSMRDIRGT